MIELKQTVHNLIGSPKDIKALENNPSPRLLIISDSHGRTQILKDIIIQYGSGCDALIFCGDGTTDLLMLLDEAASDKNFRKMLPSVIAFARGNGDGSRYNTGFSKDPIIVPERQILCANHRNFLIVHGHNEGINWGFENCGFTAQLENCKNIFYGHTHVTREDRINDFTFVNPGSCSLPRCGQPQCFAIATVDSKFVDIAHIKINRNGEDLNKYSLFTPIH